MYLFFSSARRTCSYLSRRSVIHLAPRPLSSGSLFQSRRVRLSRRLQSSRWDLVRSVSAETVVEKKEQDLRKEDDTVDDLVIHYNADERLLDESARLKRVELVEEATIFEQRVRNKPKVVPKEYWSVNYRILRWKNEVYPDVHRVIAYHTARALDFVGSAATIDESLLTSKWSQMCDKLEVAQLLSVLIGCLASSAEATLKVLRCIPRIGASSFFRFTERADVLFTLRCDRWVEIQEDPDLTRMFWDEVNKLGHATGWLSWPSRPFHPRYLDLLLQNITVEEQQPLVTNYLDKYSDLNDSALLYLMDCFTRWKQVDGALSVLRKLSPEGLERRSDIASRCMNLLMLETVENDGGSYAFKILPAVLEFGIVPDDLIYDLATQNSVSFQLPGVAWDIYRHAKSQGAYIGPRAHQMLLKDSYLRKDTNALNEILSIIQESPALYQNPGINMYMVNIVRGICMYERQSGPAESLSRILAVYDKAYSRAALARAGIIPKARIMHGNSELPNPEGLTLAFMIFSFVMVQKDVRIVTQLWDGLVAMMKRGDRDILAAGRNSVMYAGFMCFYSKHRNTIPSALGILRYMLESEMCVPGDIEWSIMVGMFLKRGSHESAEQIRELMLQRGVPVTEHAWRHILLLYPHTEIAQEVMRILGLGPESYYRDAGSDEVSNEGAGSEASENADQLVDGPGQIHGEDTTDVNWDSLTMGASMK